MRKRRSLDRIKSAGPNRLSDILDQPELANQIWDLSICRSFPYATITWINGKTEIFLKEGDEDPVKRSRVIHTIPGVFVWEIAKYIKSEGPRPLSPEEIEETLRLLRRAHDRARVEDQRRQRRKADRWQFYLDIGFLVFIVAVLVAAAWWGWE